MLNEAESSTVHFQGSVSHDLNVRSCRGAEKFGFDTTPELETVLLSTTLDAP